MSISTSHVPGSNFVNDKTFPTTSCPTRTVFYSLHSPLPFTSLSLYFPVAHRFWTCRSINWLFTRLCIGTQKIPSSIGASSFLESQAKERTTAHHQIDTELLARRQSQQWTQENSPYSSRMMDRRVMAQARSHHT